MNDNRLFTRAESAGHLSVTERTFDRIVAAGKIQPVYVGHAKRFRARDVDALVSVTAPPLPKTSCRSSGARSPSRRR
jgi:hypothetical protein